jgi:2-polyprenyl-3-methyl-5-hydroxy-6-metoxy-1,4-benzoquinol methylase
MQEHLRLTLQACQPVEDKSVLVVRCGSGAFCFHMAERGAAQVVGIDSDAAMIQEARKLAGEKNLLDRCQFNCLDFADFKPNDAFDYVIALGLFDYLRDGRHVMRKLRQLTRIKAVMTFSRVDIWRASLRKILGIFWSCPIYYYPEKRIRDHLMIAGFSIKSLLKVESTYFIEAV